MNHLTEAELHRLGEQYAAYDAAPDRVYLTFRQWLDVRVGEGSLPAPDLAATARRASEALGKRPRVFVLGILHPPLILCRSVEPRWFLALLGIRNRVRALSTWGVAPALNERAAVPAAQRRES